jgi:hypothetical protein
MDLGNPNFLGTSDLAADEAQGAPAQELRDRLSRATLFLANWYKATADSADKAIWWHDIDAVRAKVEAAYKLLSAPEAAIFPSKKENAAYDEAANAYASLYTRLNLSTDVNIHTDLISSAASLFEAIASAPAAAVSYIGNEAGKAIGGAAGNFLRQAWWVIVIGGVAAGVYVFRKPILKALGAA